MSLSYRVVRFLVRIGVLSWIRVRVEGEEHLPKSGPCLLLPNHQSALDPLLVQGICRRSVATMTKSTQFGTPFFRWILTACDAFPTRRYRVDPHAVRTALRGLEQGRIVCLYPEGERTWDGRLQPLRRGAVGLALRSGVPVIPVGIEGMFDVWPRWSSRPRLLRTVHLRFGEPIHFGVHRGRWARQQAHAEAEERIRTALLRLSGERRPPTGQGTSNAAVRTAPPSADPR